MKRTDVINFLIKENEFNSYLEIGTQTRGQNFDKVVCDTKLCIDNDPKSEADIIISSDDFFKGNQISFNVIFIDGDHSYKQSKKDVENALQHLTEDGIIIMHDTLPDNEEYTKPEWCGEAYKTALDMSKRYHVKTFNGDHGVTVIYPYIENTQEKVMLHSYDLAVLLQDLNATINLEDLNPDEVEVLEFEDSKVFDGMDDDELKAAYKAKTGKKRVAASVTREEMIEELI